MIDYGESIAVNGARPDWLGSYSGGLGYKRNDDGWFGPNDEVWTEKDILTGRTDGSGWSTIEAIRLPASHFAYTAIAAGFVPWGGGGKAPADWNGEVALRKDGATIYYPFLESRWDNGSIIGYRRLTEQPANADTVTIARMSKAQCVERFGRRQPLDVLRMLDLIREPTEAERIASGTGIDLATVERVLAARA